jgi:hypothetical protein
MLPTVCFALSFCQRMDEEEVASIGFTTKSRTPPAVRFSSAE